MVYGTPTPYGPIIVEDSTGEQLIVLFRDTDLSNAFAFSYFSQSPQVTARELIHYLARIYMNNPGAVVVVALDAKTHLSSTQQQDLPTYRQYTRCSLSTRVPGS